MEENILVTTTKLEKIFPCGSFDVIEHLSIHLVQEARLEGPVQTRWMYLFESLFVNTWDNEAIYTKFFKWLRNYQYYPNYRRPLNTSSTSQSLPSRRYEDLPL
ncbi:hypothetical protein RDI58_018091 [Solanum bulbocastanum]|uniref:DUF4218 domain-containing protein n=1 Tax=Solanum bulbocastanum TaxID=147425 RepID=A0AAN8TFV0_SOLBU